MGVKNFFKFISKYASASIKAKNINNYKNSVIGIDASLMIYKMVYAIRKNGYDLKNNGIKVTHIHGMLMKLNAFRKYKIKPVFVFDIGAPEIKMKTLDKRIVDKQKLAEKYKNSKTEKGKRIYYYASSEITFNEIEECKELIRIYGYNIIEAKEEADAQLGYLSKKELIDYVASDDMDIILFGAKNILKSFTIDEKKIIYEIDSTVIKKELQISHKQLVDIGILLGTDYCNIQNPIVKTFKMINEYGSIGKIDDIKTLCEDAQKYFLRPPVINISKINNNKKIDIDGLKEFLINHEYDVNYYKKFI